jgi:hypothetical protein
MNLLQEKEKKRKDQEREIAMGIKPKKTILLAHLHA